MTKKPWFKNYDPQVPHHLTYPQISVVDMLEYTAHEFPSKACTIYRNTTITYQQMVFLVNRLANALIRLDLHPGDRIGLLMNNIPQFVLAYFASLKTRAVVVAINPLYKPNEIIHLVNDAGIKIMIVLDNLYPMIKSLQSQTNLQKIIVTRSTDLLPSFLNRVLSSVRRSSRGFISRPSPTDYWFNDLLHLQDKEDFSLPNPKPSDIALFQYSGGTTGVTKAAIALHRNLIANALQFRHWLHTAKTGEETMLMAIPLYHVYGMVVGMLVAIQVGASLVMIPSPRNIDEILHCAQKYKATLFPGVPNLYQAINNHPDVQAGKYNLSSIKACISGSAPLLPDTKRRFEALTGGKVVEGYGLSEAPTATHCNPILNENRVGSIGLPLPDVDCRIVSLEDNVTDLPIGEAGELIIKGPQVMQGYHNMPAETAATLRDGWLYTGDIARMDQDGYFYLIDRKKELIKPGGFQVWPREVEDVLVHHPAVLEAAVAGVFNPVRGEEVAAWIILKSGYLASLKLTSKNNTVDDEAIDEAIKEEIRTFCKNELASYKVPSYIEFINELPKTSVGKVLRRELVRQYNRRYIS